MVYLVVVQEGVIVLDVVGGLVVGGLVVGGFLEEAQGEVLVGVDVLPIFLAYLSFNSKILLYLELKFVG